MTALPHVLADSIFAADATNSHRPAASICANVKVVSTERVSALANLLLGVSYAAFIGAISHVFTLRPDLQMFWVKARRIVAFMENYPLTFKWEPMPDEGRHSMKTNNSTVKIDTAVASRILGSMPNPATVLSGNSHVKSLLQSLLIVTLFSVLAFGQGTVMPILGSTVAPSGGGVPTVPKSGATTCANFTSPMSVTYTPSSTSNLFFIHIGQANTPADQSGSLTVTPNAGAISGPTLDGKYIDAVSNNMAEYWLSFTITSGSPTSFSVGGLNTGSGLNCVSILEASGVTTKDQAVTGSAGGFVNTNWTAGTTGTTGFANELVLGGCMNDATVTIGAAGSFTLGTTGNNASVTGCIVYQIVSATGTYAATGTKNTFSHTNSTTVTYH